MKMDLNWFVYVTGEQSTHGNRFLVYRSYDKIKSITNFGLEAFFVGRIVQPWQRFVSSFHCISTIG